MKDRRRLLGLAVAAVLAVATWWIQGTGPDQPQEPAATSSVTTDDTRDTSGSELPVVAGMLRPGGVFHLMYTPPAGSDLTRLERAILPRLAELGFDVDLQTKPVDSDLLVAFVARLAA